MSSDSDVGSDSGQPREVPEESDWGLTMSNSPNLGPLETLKVAWKRLRGGDSDGE